MWSKFGGIPIILSVGTILAKIGVSDSSNSDGDFYYAAQCGISTYRPPHPQNQRQRNFEKTPLSMSQGHMVPDEWSLPWMASIALSFNRVGLLSFCSATIVSENYVLVGADCLTPAYMYSGYGPSGPFPPMEWYLLNVRVGINNFTFISKSENQTYESGRLIPHPNYTFTYFTPPEFRNDIGLIKLRKPIKFSETVKPVCLAKDYNYEGGNEAISAGWGFLAPTKFYSRRNNIVFRPTSKLALSDDEPTNFNMTLFDEYLKLLASPENCPRGIKPSNMNQTICVKDDNRARQTQLVLEGPLFDVDEMNLLADDNRTVKKNKQFLYKQIGIASTWEKNLQYTTFTRVSAYCDWIQTVTENEVVCV